MTITRLTFIAAMATMAIAVAIALASGGFVEEGRVLIASTWGRLTLIDLYVGLVLFSAFVIWREQSTRSALVWITAFVVLGNLATAAYLVLAMTRVDSVDELLQRRRR
jgi:hypothetical protein